MEKNISDNFWSLRLNLQGGRIIELKYRGDTVLGTFNRIDGKEGNTHLCLPNFGAEGRERYNLPFHGYARTVNWEVAGGDFQMPTTTALRCFLPKTAAYPAELRVTQEFLLEKEFFRHTVTVENLLGEPVPVNIGIHNYWAVPAGWEGALLNSETITEKVKANGFSPIEEENHIALPGGRTYRWKVTGGADAVLWTGRKDGAYDTEYVCVEPVRKYDSRYFGSPSSLLAEHRTVSLSQEISL